MENLVALFAYSPNTRMPNTLRFCLWAQAARREFRVQCLQERFLESSSVGSAHIKLLTVYTLKP